MNSEEINFNADLTKVLPADKDTQEGIEAPTRQRPMTPGIAENPISLLKDPSNKPMTAQDRQRKDQLVEEALDADFLPETISHQTIDAEVKEGIAQSLAKKAIQKRVMSSVQKDQKQSLNDIRNQFGTYLSKVYDNDAGKEGVQGCHRLINRYKTDPQILRIIIGELSNRSTQAAQQQKGVQGLIFHVQMFGYLAKCYQTELKDPLDKPPSLIKTVNRIQESIYTFFKEDSKLVWRGCALSLAEILDNCFPDRTTDGLESVANMFIEPLLKFLRGGFDRMQQKGASYCIKHLIENFIEKEYTDLIDLSHQSIISTTTKHRIDNAEQIAAVIKLIEHLGVKVAQSHINGLLTLAIKSLSTPNQQSLIKSAACNLLYTLAVHLKPVADLVVPQYQRDVIAALDLLIGDKLNKVQEARTQARQEWLALEEAYNQMDPAQKSKVAQMLGHHFRQTIKSPVDEKRAGDLNINQGNKLKMLRDIAKQNNENQKRQVSEGRNNQGVRKSMEQEEIFDDINQSQRLLAKDFLRKGKGQGGGNQSSPAQSKDRKLYDDLKHISELNSMMKEGSPNKQDTFKQQLLSMLRPVSAPKQLNFNVNQPEQPGLAGEKPDQASNPYLSPPQNLGQKPINTNSQYMNQNQNIDPTQLSPDSQHRFILGERQRLKQKADQLMQNNPNLHKFNPSPSNQRQNYNEPLNGNPFSRHAEGQSSMPSQNVKFIDSLEPSQAVLQKPGHTHELMPVINETGERSYQHSQDMHPSAKPQSRPNRAQPFETPGQQHNHYVPTPIAEANSHQLKLSSAHKQQNKGFQEDPDIDKCEEEVEENDLNDRDSATADRNTMGRLRSSIIAPQKDIIQNQPPQWQKDQRKTFPTQKGLIQNESQILSSNQNPQAYNDQHNIDRDNQYPRSQQKQPLPGMLNHKQYQYPQQPFENQASPQNPIQNHPSLQELGQAPQRQQRQIPQPQVQQSPNIANQIAQMIQQQMVGMQSSMEKGFTALCDKIGTIENRVDKAQMKLEVFERAQVEEQKQFQQKDIQNKQILRRFSDTLSTQQEYIKRQQQKAEQDRENIVKLTLQQQQAQKKAILADDQKKVEQDMVNPTGNVLQQREQLVNNQELQFHEKNGSSQPPLPPIHSQSFGNLPQIGGSLQRQQAKSPHRQTKLTQVWTRAMDLIKKRQYEDAYRFILREGDDIYFLRLVAQTGPVVKQLEDSTAITVITKINKILRSGVFEVMEIEWLEDASRRGLFASLTKHEQNEYLDTLFHFSRTKINPKISERATDVYNQIKTVSTTQAMGTKRSNMTANFNTQLY